MGRVIKVKMNHSKRKLALIAQDKQRTMFTRLALAFACIVALAAALSFGPVWLVADATRMQTETALLKVEIDDALTANQKLMIDVAVLKSSDRLTRIATERYGMVESPPATSWVTLDENADEGPATSTQSADGLLGRISALALSEASALLVGDVGISALR